MATSKLTGIKKYFTFDGPSGVLAADDEGGLNPITVAGLC